MAMASLNASLLARKGTARPVASIATAAPTHPNRIEFISPEIRTVPPQKKAATGKTKPSVTGNAVNHNWKRKSVRLTTCANNDLRLLAARLGLSQQALMEKAINNYLETAYQNLGCICRTSDQ